MNDQCQKLMLYPQAEKLADTIHGIYRWWESLPQRGPATSHDLDVMTFLIEGASGRASSLASELRREETTAQGLPDYAAQARLLWTALIQIHTKAQLLPGENMNDTPGKCSAISDIAWRAMQSVSPFVEKQP